MASTEVSPDLRHLWASPAYFITGAFIAFNIFGNRGVGWALMAAGLLGPLGALVWGAFRRERPDSFGIIPVGALVLFTVLFGIAEGFPWS
ncbi:hypothetical protein OHA84_37080 [Streptomyces sp. NBC_00513]|uniref:hypothetical protein n=1 Tax=unclassified Streptomyces TaxID=2593676 RepID=UPI0022575AC6|nr:hypothetical protein [Streptomyces sp. NBC_00424]MCX5078614.1 hypothetical protein [Streptomyces sp. NBC_00424]WUD39059.1 hypothetical protein OHA84_00220 [Streptomyces sp. NBC_00513]WUD45670.1 hypothetical protein OHA84_37080 [Streptomyces sp. NBC_00513]